MPPHEAFSRLAALVWPKDSDASLIADVARGSCRTPSTWELEQRAEAARGVLENRASELSTVDDGGVIPKALELSRKLPWLDWLSNTLEKVEALDEDRLLRVAVLGTFSAGKSSLINAWIGHPLLSVGDIPVTARTTTLRYGAEPKALIHLRDGTIRELSLDEARDAADQRKAAGSVKIEDDPVKYIEIEYPSEQLRGLELVDTPGFNSGHHAHGIVTAEILKQADVVLWIFSATKPGADLEARELEIIQHTTARVIGVINGIDLISRPKYPTDPTQYKRLAKWEEHLQDSVDAISRSCGESISSFITTSAPWIEAGHPRSGRDQLHQVINNAARESSNLMAQAREKRQVDCRRLSHALIGLHLEENRVLATTQGEVAARGNAYIQALKTALDDIDQINEGAIKRSQRVAREMSVPHALVLAPELLKTHFLLSRVERSPTTVETWSDLHDFASNVFPGVEFVRCDIATIQQFDTLALLMFCIQVEGDEGSEWRHVLKRIRSAGTVDTSPPLFSFSGGDGGARYEMLRGLGRIARNRYGAKQAGEEAGLSSICSVLGTALEDALRTALNNFSEKIVSGSDWSLPGLGQPVDIDTALFTRPMLLLGIPKGEVIPEGVCSSLVEVEWKTSPLGHQTTVIERQVFSLVAEQAKTIPLRDLVPGLAQAFETARAEALDGENAVRAIIARVPPAIAPVIARAMNGILLSTSGLYYDRKLPIPKPVDGLVDIDDIAEAVRVRDKRPQHQCQPAFSEQRSKLKLLVTSTADGQPPTTRRVRALLADDLTQFLEQNDRGASAACQKRMFNYDWASRDGLDPSKIHLGARRWFKFSISASILVTLACAGVWAADEILLNLVLRDGGEHLVGEVARASTWPLKLLMFYNAATACTVLWSRIRTLVEVRRRAIWSAMPLGLLALVLLPLQFQYGAAMRGTTAAKIDASVEAKKVAAERVTAEELAAEKAAVEQAAAKMAAAKMAAVEKTLAKKAAVKAADRQYRLDAARTEIRAKATQDFASVQAFVKMPTRQGVEALEAWLGRYGNIKVTVDGVEHSVEISEAGRVRAALALANNIEWIRIEGGSFSMGSNGGDKNETPVHRVKVPTFYLAKNEVTVKQYEACMGAGKCTKPHWDNGSCWSLSSRGAVQGRVDAGSRSENQPVTCVTWHQARTFSEWIGGRLPTEAEWEFAAKSGGRNRKYPWGYSSPTCDRAVMSGNGWGCGREQIWPVCSKPRGSSVQGVCDLAGNVWEWVEDAYSDNYISTPRDGSAYSRGGSKRVNRGGGWYSGRQSLSTARRSSNRPNSSASDLGFRPAMSAP